MRILLGTIALLGLSAGALADDGRYRGDRHDDGHRYEDRYRDGDRHREWRREDWRRDDWRRDDWRGRNDRYWGRGWDPRRAVPHRHYHYHYNVPPRRYWDPYRGRWYYGAPRYAPPPPRYWRNGHRHYGPRPHLDVTLSIPLR